MIGRTIGKYRIVGQLGRGGMGTVYRAIDETLDCEVAIKVLNPELADSDIIKPFQVEARELLNKEQDVLGSRYVSRIEVVETLDIVARGEVWPLVTDMRPLEEAEALHQKVEAGEVIGRAALRISPA